MVIIHSIQIRYYFHRGRLETISHRHRMCCMRQSHLEIVFGDISEVGRRVGRNLLRNPPPEWQPQPSHISLWYDGG